MIISRPTGGCYLVKERLALGPKSIAEIPDALQNMGGITRAHELHSGPGLLLTVKETAATIGKLQVIATGTRYGHDNFLLGNRRFRPNIAL
jgi:hypothetical protein